MHNGIKLDKIKILKLLAKNRWTYTDLAKKMGMSRQTISLHLMERQNTRLTTLYRFADALQVEAVELIKENTVENTVDN